MYDLSNLSIKLIPIGISFYNFNVQSCFWSISEVNALIYYDNSKNIKFIRKKRKRKF